MAVMLRLQQRPTQPKAARVWIHWCASHLRAALRAVHIYARWCLGILTTFSDSAELCTGVALHFRQQCTRPKTARTLDLFVSVPGFRGGWYVTQGLLIVSCIDSSTYRSRGDVRVGARHSFIKNNCSAGKCLSTRLWQQSHLCTDCVRLRTGLPQLW